MVIELDDVWVSYYEKSAPALKGVCLKVVPGDAIAIVGPSGSGKTTLLRVILGFLKPTRGRVEVLGQAPWERETLSPRIGYIPQQLGLVQNLTALENTLLGALSRLGFWRSILGAFPTADVERAMVRLESVGLAHKANKKVCQLSGGERQRVAIARALLQDPDILLADEFLSDLDYPRACEILDMMKDINRNGQTMVMVTHDLALASQWGERAVIMNQGEKVAEVERRNLSASSLMSLLTCKCN